MRGVTSGGVLLNIKINLPELNNIAKFRATLIFKSIASLNASNSYKKEITKKVIDKLDTHTLSGATKNSKRG